MNSSIHIDLYKLHPSVTQLNANKLLHVVFNCLFSMIYANNLKVIHNVLI